MHRSRHRRHARFSFGLALAVIVATVRVAAAQDAPPEPPPPKDASTESEEEEARPTVVLDLSDNAKIHTAIRHQVEQAVEGASGYALQDIHGVLNAGAESDARGTVRTAESFQDDGVDALRSGDPEKAANKLDSAAGLLEGHLALLPDASRYRKLMLQLGEANQRAGNREEALRAFEKAVLFGADDASVELPKASRELLSEAKERLNGRPKGAVRLRSQPPNAELYVNGIYRGVTPATVAGLPEGKHVVTLYKTGFVRHTSTIEASSKGFTNETIELARARRKSLVEETRSKIGEQLEQARETGTGTEAVDRLQSFLLSETGVILKTTGPKSSKQIELHLFDADSRALVNHVSGRVDWTSRKGSPVAELVDELLSVNYSKALAEATGATMGDGDTEEAEGGVAGEWWFWTIIGVGAAGGATAAALTATRGDDPDTGSIVVQF